MNPSPRLSQRLIRWTSLYVAVALVLSCFALFPVRSANGSSGRLSTQGQGNPRNDKARSVPAAPPQPGPPQAKLPNLDNAGSAIPRAPKAPDPIPSAGPRRRPNRLRGALLTPNSSLLAASSVAGRREMKADVSSGLHRTDSLRSLSDSTAALFSYSNSAVPLPPFPSSSAMARIDPHNRTGGGGEDLLSNNLNWNLPLVSLPGRGLDLGLTLSYNSLVWTRSTNSVDFDLDDGMP